MKVNGAGGANRSGQVYMRRIAEKLRAAGISSGSEGDQVEISDIGRALSKLSQLPDVRQEKVAALRREIEKGSYDVDSKIDELLDSILEDLGIPPENVPR